MGHVLKQTAERRSRSDAVRNRAAILEAASKAFAAHGEKVDVREIARCAGVGMGTLYRHFPTKEELLETVLHQDFAAWTRTARESVAQCTDPFDALSAFLEDALGRQSRHRAMVERFAESWNTTSQIATCQQELHPVIDDLVTRCHAAEALRPDVTSEDVSLLLVALGRIAQLTAQERPELWRRTLQIMLDGLHPTCMNALPPFGSDSLDQR